MVLAVLVAATAVGCGKSQTRATWRDDGYLRDHGVWYWLEVRTTPRPLRLHHLQVDLRHPRIEMAAVPAADPDGDGPATAALESPLAIARRSGAIALINANPWQGMPDLFGHRRSDWHEGMHVQPLGLVVTKGQVRGTPSETNCGVWVDQEGAVHMGNPPDLAAVREGVAGFGALVQDGRLVPEAGGPIHPRTAIGVDGSGRWLHVVVVDGRQRGYSEGLSTYELAEVMKGRGGREAVNLDGGGSSILILADRRGERSVVNDPSTKQLGKSVPRPIPVAWVLREKGE